MRHVVAIVFAATTFSPAFVASLAAGRDGALERRLLRQQPLHAHADTRGLVQPIRFKQSLLICNAYPSNASISVRKNERETLAGPGDGLAFRECRSIDTSVRPQDKLDMSLVGAEIEGTFEVGELPASDAVLLLVLRKRQGSSTVAFQSFAFPQGQSGTEAHLAIIDAFDGRNATAPHLRMEDHITKKESRAALRRMEELKFDRVYAVEEGTYDATVMVRQAQGAQETASGARRLLKVARNRNYVILRTGSEDVGQTQELVVYPDMRSAAALRSGLAAFAGAALASLAFAV